MNRRRAIAALALALLAYGCSHPLVNAAEDVVAGEYLVTLAPGADAKAIGEVYGRFGVKSVAPLGNGVYRVALAQDPGRATLEKLAAASRDIKAVQPNYRYRAR